MTQHERLFAETEPQTENIFYPITEKRVPNFGVPEDTKIPFDVILQMIEDTFAN